MTPTRDPIVVVRGPGPGWLRISFAALAVFYFIILLADPPMKGAFRSLWYFAECTRLFPEAKDYDVEYRLEGWSCSARVWQPLDPRPYFPMEADDKESRFQRIGHFYDRKRKVMHALDTYIYKHHKGSDDGVDGDIGGIRLFRVARPLPHVGDPVERYVYQPLAPVPAEWRTDLYWTPESKRQKRCLGNAGSAESTAVPEEEP